MKWQGGEESSNLEDRRRMGPKTAAVGIGGAVIVIIGLLLGLDPRQINQFVNNAQPPDGGQQDQRPLTPQEEKQRKFAATILGFTEQVWTEQFAKSGEKYQKPKMVLFSEAVRTGGCGDAPSSVGPFYCPADRTVYLDPSFFDELEGRLGGSKAEFSQAYVIAHEVGHHVQNLLGYSRIVDEKRRTLPKAEFNKWSVRLELQADYLAGVWAHYGQEKFKFIEPGDIESAIQTAQAIGDDRIQRRSGGFVSPESFTHGTSAQRVKWFRLGLETGNLSMLKKIFELPYNDL
ncbi:MAG: neutral zinc metallopeptidase [Gemmataceae bacterium]